MPASRPGRRLAFVSLLVLATCGDAGEPGPPTGPDTVLLDGDFAEWTRARRVVDDPADAPEAALDIRSIQGLDEAPWLFLALDLGREVTVQRLPGTLHLLVDADDESSTGEELHGMPGVDIVLELSPGGTAAGRGSGLSLTALGGDDAPAGVTSHALGVTAAPTWSASRFELRMSRLGGSGFPALGGEVRLKAVYTEGGRVADETDVGSYRFRTEPHAPPPGAPAHRLTRREDALRVVQWNVASRSFDINRESFARVLAVLAPDVVLLDEAPAGTTTESVGAFFDLRPLADLGEWRFEVGRTGGRQRTVVAARNRDVRPAETLQTVRYPPGAFDTLATQVPESFRRLLETEQARGLSATGAWVAVEGTDVLFVPVDLQSAGWAGSPQDLLRDLQARTLRNRVDEERRVYEGPVVIGGDLNLVGSRKPLSTLVQGLDTDGSDLRPVDAVRLGEGTLATWRNPEAPFAPGRLDFLLVPAGAVEVVDAFVFTTEDLSPDALRSLGLEVTDSRVSDHLPVVADLRLR
jgi:endonuclease/exonuclease/phosphatase family metal-dependent hydrolase